MMYVAPIVDLWTGIPVAYVLTDENGEPKTTDTPRELYMYVIEALKRDFSPVVVYRPSSMKADAAWTQFKKDVPAPVWVYENGSVIDENGCVVMRESGDNVESRWQRKIDNKKEHDSAMRAGVHYGSGNALIEPDELSVQRENRFSVAWGE